MTLPRCVIVAAIFLALSSTTPCQTSSKHEVNFPTKTEILLIVTQSQRAVESYKPLIDQEEKLLGKEGEEAVKKDREVLALVQVSINDFSKNPEEFNGPLGFVFFEALDDASRNAALCSGNATNAVIGNILDKKLSDYESGMRLAQSCIDVSTLFYTISENAGALYSRYVESLQQTAQLGADTATKCADILKKQGVLPKK
jgi:hypothetical protein